MSYLENTRFIKKIANVKEVDNLTLPQFAFIGRSNVGKSSLLNMISNSKIAHISKKAGKTTYINLFHSKIKKYNFYLLDMAGYGFAKMSIEDMDKSQNLIIDYLQNSKLLKKLFILIDARRFLDKKDMELIKICELLSINYQLIFTKIDKINQAQFINLEKDFNIFLNDNKLSFMSSDFIYVSNLKKINYDLIIKIINSKS